MFKEIRRQDRAISTEEMREILQKGEYGVLATYGNNGYPYAVPVSYVYLEECIYFHCAQEGNKLENIKNHEEVSFCVVGDTKVLPAQFSTVYESVILFGKAVEATVEEKKKALKELIVKYSPAFEKEGAAYIERAAAKTNVIKIQVERMTGKARKE